VVKRVFEHFGQTIAKETLSNSMSFATLDGEAIDCGDHMVRLAVEKE